MLNSQAAHLTDDRQGDVIIGEESVAAGTRRITALTGKAALRNIRQSQATLSRAAAALRDSAGRVADRG